MRQTSRASAGRGGSRGRSAQSYETRRSRPVCSNALPILAYRSNKLIGVDSAYADGDVLRPGATARYSTSLLVDQDPDRFGLSVRGRVAD